MTAAQESESAGPGAASGGGSVTGTATATSTAIIDEQSGGPPTVEWVPVEPWPGPPPVPVLAPYLGLVAAVLCAVGGGWLLLAPYALDFRHGAARLPRTAAVDLDTGAAIVAVAVVTAALFSMALARRLRANPPGGLEEFAASEESEEIEGEAGLGFESESGPAPEPEPTPAPAYTPPQQADPGGALRELLTPLVAALAADLRSHDQDQDHRAREERDQHRRQEP